MNVISSLYSALYADDALSALIAEHEGEPAIFSSQVAPMDVAALPYIMIGPIADQTPADDMSTPQRFADVRVRLFCLAGNSSKPIDDAAERVRVILHRKSLPPASGETFRPRGPVSGPRECSTSGPEVAGRQMAIRLYVKG